MEKRHTKQRDVVKKGSKNRTHILTAESVKAWNKQVAKLNKAGVRFY